MGCNRYCVKNYNHATREDGEAWIGFSDSDDTGCLCTFPGSDGASRERVALLAMVGAAVVLARRSGQEDWRLPRDLPDEIVKGIRLATGTFSTVPSETLD